MPTATLTTKSGHAITVDENDLPFLSSFTWCVSNKAKPGKTPRLYAQTRILGKVVTMHSLLLGPTPKGMLPDHVDRDGLNNTRKNLHWATRSHNNRNRAPAHSKLHGLPVGVTLVHGGKFTARVRDKGHSLFLGLYDSVERAVTARNAAVEALASF